MLLDGGQGLTHPISKASGHLAQGAQDIFFPGCLHLLLIEDITSAAAPGLQGQHILASDGRNRALEDRSAPGAFADCPSEFWSKPRVRTVPHQAKRVRNPLIRNQAEIGRLPKLNRQTLAQGLVEHRVTRGVGKASEHNRVFCAENRWVTRYQSPHAPGNDQ